jgi:hypothetical protein
LHSEYGIAKNGGRDRVRPERERPAVSGEPEFSTPLTIMPVQIQPQPPPVKPSQTQSNQIKPNQTKSNQIKVNQSTFFLKTAFNWLACAQPRQPEGKPPQNRNPPKTCSAAMLSNPSLWAMVAG